MIQKIGRFLSCGIKFTQLDPSIDEGIQFVDFPTQKGYFRKSKESWTTKQAQYSEAPRGFGGQSHFLKGLK